jgi:fructose-1,6-bisphosphatase/inositol monophosphatase family enzyme
VFGIIDVPCTGERWVGVRGRGSWLNGERCRTRTGSRLQDAILQTTSPDLFAGEDARAFERLSSAVHLRRFGGDCYAYALLASGTVDLVAEAGLMPYDYLALAPVIEGAGGVITDWRGGPLGPRSDGRVLAAANADLHRQALRILAADA